MSSRLTIGLILIGLCTLTSEVTFGQNIPPERIYNWSEAGLQDTIPQPVNILNIVELGAANNGSNSANPFVTQAIDSLSGSFGVIYFPPGQYLIDQGIKLNDSIILRGAGADSTTLKFNFGGNASDGIDVTGTGPNGFVNITGGHTKGSDTILALNSSSFRVGDYAEVRQENGAWDTNPASYAEYAVGQMVKIIAIDSNQIVITPPLRIDYDQLLNPQIGVYNPVEHVGIECLKIAREDSSLTGPVYNINFRYANNCWVSGIESDKSAGSHVMIEHSSHIYVRGSYFHHAFDYSGSGTMGYGVTIRQHASECLVENNVFQFLRHAMMVKEGANGNVFAYNYSVEPNRSEPIANFSGDISVHGHYPFANLFEGNVVQNIIIDHYWGQAGPHNTFFRNRAELYGIIVTPNANATNDQNFVGNEITNTGLLFGNYTLEGTGHFELANNVKGTTTPAGSDAIGKVSLYKNDLPNFWSYAISWPAVGYPNSINDFDIPSEIRYNDSTLVTTCMDMISDSTVDTTHVYVSDINRSDIIIYPNPFTEQIQIDLSLSNKHITSTITFYDLTGKLVKQAELPNRQSLKISTELRPGLYVLEIINENISFSTRIIKME